MKTKINVSKTSGWIVILGASAVFFGTAYGASVTSIDFKNSGATSEIDIQSDGPLVFDKQENANDKQIVLDLKDATLSKNASRKMDTSSFDSKVLLISPYQVPGDAKGSRVVIQLRDMASASVTQSGNVLKVSVPNGADPGSSNTNSDANAAVDIPPPPPATAEGNAQATADTGLPVPGPTTAPELEVGKVSTSAENQLDQAKAVGGSNGIKDKLGEFIESRETRHFTGKPITLKVRDADLVDIFRLIGDTSGFNIIVGDDVKGKVTLSLEDVPWDQALDVILRTQKLGAERNNNLLRIVTLTNLTQEKQAELAARVATEATAPRITRVFPISYAKLDEMSLILNKFSGSPTVPSAPGVPGAPAPNSAAAQNNGIVVQADPRTNSIIVRDTAENVERMKKLIDLLDTQTPQVLIEAKIVEATEGFQNSLGGQIGFGKGTGNSQYFGSFAGANPIDPLFSNGGNSIFASGSAAGAASSAAVPGATLALSPQLAFLPGSTRLNAILNLSEGESNARVISSPKAVVLDKEKASIIESTPVLISTTAVTATGPVSTPSVVQANLSLDVTPTITNDGSVLMQLAVSRDVPFNLPGSNGQAVANRNINTRVLVESGSTLVMGGIYTMDKESASSGFPILRKIPILGALFGSESSSTARTELFFFITPRILNLKESGISG